jgi:predicted Zn-dependent protease
LGQEAVRQLIAEYGGLHSDQGFRACFQAVGERIVQMSDASDTPWQFQFYLLDDSQTINAFALHGGPGFITDALFSRLENEAQLAGIVGHEIGHVVARHSAQRIAQNQLTEGILGAILTASGSYDATQVAAIIGQLINMQYGRDDELQSDTLGVRFMADAGYDPRELIGVMGILADATGGARQPEFFSTHPNPDNRIQEIQEEISAVFPNGVPDSLRTDSVVCG